MPCSQKLLTLLLIISHLPNKQSRPMRARGLKLVVILSHDLFVVSRPMRARGLKHHPALILIGLIGVAPHAGAWVEAIFVIQVLIIGLSRPMRARGLTLR